MNRKLTTEEASNIIVRYIETEDTMDMLADDYNVSIDTISNIINGKYYREATEGLVETAKAAAEYKMKNYKLTKKEKDKIVKRYILGNETLKEVANAYDITHESVRYYLKDSYVKIFQVIVCYGHDTPSKKISLTSQHEYPMFIIQSRSHRKEMEAKIEQLFDFIPWSKESSKIKWR